MIKFRLLLAMSLLYLGALPSMAQKDLKPGFIIKNHVDTINGFIDLGSNFKNSKACRFYQSADGSAEVFHPGEITAFRIENSKLYISKEVSIDSIKQTVFLEFLLSGIINLYYLKEPNVDRYFLETDGRMIALSNEEIIGYDEYGGKYAYDSNRHRNVLAYLFKEYPDLVKDVQTIKLDHKPLIEVAKKYHYEVCEGEECYDYTKSMKSNWFIEPYGGVSLSWLGLENSSDKAQSVDPLVGVNFRFASSRVHYLWNFVTGLKLSTNNFSGDFKAAIYNEKLTTYRIDAKYAVISIPLKVEYYLPIESFQPYLSIGYTNTFLLGSEYEARKVWNEPPMVGPAMETKFQPYHGGIVIGGGVRKALANKNYFYLNCEYEYRQPLVNTRYILEYINVSSVNFTLGYAFNK
ncbi:hypothetical protein [Carboxylicivirga sp. N1Y90]|uniref:hypothetical protein n=1 Tax=Carboxylicivirga fragile TaxID=3417571 RepID=UPI003D34AB26|nr:outer membrane beta-barrel protein [Marinilabiliaceae bacterium N1Y90]